MIASAVRTQLRLLLSLIAVLGLSLVAVPAASAKTEHCSATLDGYTGVKVEDGSSPGTIQVYDRTTGKYISVVVTITGAAFTLTPVDPSVSLTDAGWCVKSSTNVNYGSGTSGDSTSQNKNGVIQDISYVMTYWVKSGTPPVTCQELVQSGSVGTHSYTFDLGTTAATSFWMLWGPFTVPDRIVVTYGGQTVWDSGPSTGEYAHEVTVPGGSSQVTIAVTSSQDEPNLNWGWYFAAKCPGQKIG
ncbi:MAG: hypothetical protein ACTHOK_02580 [Nocardioidaceae bacterium]